MAPIEIDQPGPPGRKKVYPGPYPIPDYIQDEPPFEIPNLPDSKFEDEVPITIVPRTAWGARPPKSEVPMRFPIYTVKFTSEDIYKRDSYLTKALQKTQAFYMDDMKKPDVPFNFLVDDGGLIYEGRGWNTSPGTGEKEHVLEIAFVGDYSGPHNPPSYFKCDAAHSLLQQGVRQEMVYPQYEIISMRDSATADPENKWMKWFPNHDNDRIPVETQYNH